MLQLYSKALHQKDTKANSSPFLMGWVNPALSKERAVLRTNFSNEKFGFNNPIIYFATTQLFVIICGSLYIKTKNANIVQLAE